MTRHCCHASKRIHRGPTASLGYRRIVTAKKKFNRSAFCEGRAIFPLAVLIAIIGNLACYLLALNGVTLVRESPWHYAARILCVSRTRHSAVGTRLHRVRSAPLVSSARRELRLRQLRVPDDDQQQEWATTKPYVYLTLSYATYPIGFVVSHVVLALIYYVGFTFFGLALRLFRHDPLALRRDSNATTYWKVRNQERPPHNYFCQS